jgi:hypothetical protein
VILWFNKIYDRIISFLYYQIELGVECVKELTYRLIKNDLTKEKDFHPILLDYQASDWWDPLSVKANTWESGRKIFIASLSRTETDHTHLIVNAVVDKSQRATWIPLNWFDSSGNWIELNMLHF